MSKPQVTQLRRSSKEILQAVDRDSPSSETVQSRLSGVKQRQRRLLAKVHKKQSDMERDMNVFKTFHDHLKNLDTWLADVDTAELDQPISIEPDGVREQIHKTEVSEAEEKFDKKYINRSFSVQYFSVSSDINHDSLL